MCDDMNETETERRYFETTGAYLTVYGVTFSGYHLYAALFLATLGLAWWLI